MKAKSKKARKGAISVKGVASIGKSKYDKDIALIERTLKGLIAEGLVEKNGDRYRLTVHSKTTKITAKR